MSAKGQKRTLHYSTTSSVRRVKGGTLRPSDLAVLMFDDELELPWLNDRRVGRFFTAENTADINPGITIGVSSIWSVGQKSTQRNADGDDVAASSQESARPRSADL